MILASIFLIYFIYMIKKSIKEKSISQFIISLIGFVSALALLLFYYNTPIQTAFLVA